MFLGSAQILALTVIAGDWNARLNLDGVMGTLAEPVPFLDRMLWCYVFQFSQLIQHCNSQERGMSRQDAEDVIGKMAKYDDFFVNLMMNEELGLQVCAEHDVIGL